MSVRPEVRAVVALAAAYALVLQAAVLVIGIASAAEYAGLGAPTLCSHPNGASRHSAPVQESPFCCTAVCLGCCCAAMVPPAASPAFVSRRLPAQRPAPLSMFAAVLPPPLAHANRSRAPPLA